jgi:hypothetical protein
MCYATGTIPCSDVCDEAGRCLLSSTGENDDKNSDVQQSAGAIEGGALCIERGLERPESVAGTSET